MVAFNRTLQAVLEKGQGTAARTLDRLPRFAQKSLVKILRYPHQYPELDPLVQCMMAAQLKRGNSGFVTEDLIQARKNFDLQIQSIKRNGSKIYVYLYTVAPYLRGITIQLPVKSCRW